MTYRHGIISSGFKIFASDMLTFDWCCWRITTLLLKTPVVELTWCPLKVQASDLIWNGFGLRLHQRGNQLNFELPGYYLPSNQMPLFKSLFTGIAVFGLFLRAKSISSICLSVLKRTKDSNYSPKSATSQTNRGVIDIGLTSNQNVLWFSIRKNL